MTAHPRSANAPLDFVTENEAWVTFASSEPTDRQWRCAVSERHYPSPDIRERQGREGYGRSAREAISACMADLSHASVV